jgi:hypothetical protein
MLVSSRCLEASAYAAVTLALFTDARNVVVMCFDEVDGMPVRQSPTIDQTPGRGLVLVEALSENFWA